MSERNLTAEDWTEVLPRVADVEPMPKGVDPEPDEPPIEPDPTP